MLVFCIPLVYIGMTQLIQASPVAQQPKETDMLEIFIVGAFVVLFGAAAILAMLGLCAVVFALARVIFAIGF